jgi:hypothetical protein
MTSPVFTALQAVVVDLARASTNEVLDFFLRIPYDWHWQNSLPNASRVAFADIEGVTVLEVINAYGEKGRATFAFIIKAFFVPARELDHSVLGSGQLAGVSAAQIVVATSLSDPQSPPMTSSLARNCTKVAVQRPASDQAPTQICHYDEAASVPFLRPPVLDIANCSPQRRVGKKASITSFSTCQAAAQITRASVGDDKSWTGELGLSATVTYGYVDGLKKNIAIAVV